MPNQSPISASRPSNAEMTAPVSSSSTCASWLDKPPVSCEDSCDWLVEMGPIHCSHRLMNSLSTTCHTSSAHCTTWRMTVPRVLAKSGSR